MGAIVASTSTASSRCGAALATSCAMLSLSLYRFTFASTLWSATMTVKAIAMFQLQQLS